MAVQSWNCRNGLNLHGSNRRTCVGGNLPRGCESAGHPKFARTTKSFVLPAIRFVSCLVPLSQLGTRQFTACEPNLRGDFLRSHHFRLWKWCETRTPARSPRASRTRTLSFAALPKTGSAAIGEEMLTSRRASLDIKASRTKDDCARNAVDSALGVVGSSDREADVEKSFARYQGVENHALGGGKLRTGHPLHLVRIAARQRVNQRLMFLLHLVGAVAQRQAEVKQALHLLEDLCQRRDQSIITGRHRHRQMELAIRLQELRFALAIPRAVARRAHPVQPAQTELVHAPSGKAAGRDLDDRAQLK